MSNIEPQNFEIHHSLFDILRFKKLLFIGCDHAFLRAGPATVKPPVLPEDAYLFKSMELPHLPGVYINRRRTRA
jgi:hypothetical protein